MSCQYILYWAACYLAVALPAHALTIYRIGGADLPKPELEAEYEFVQLSWEAVEPNQHGQAQWIALQPERIGPLSLTPSVNLAPLVESLGGRILILEWNGWREWYEDDILIFDGDPETAYLGDGRYLRVVGYGPQRKYWVFDFGGRFFVDRVRFYPRPRFAATRFVESFILGTSDGDPLVDGTREYAVSWRNSTLDFDIVHRVRENTQAVMELALPEEPIQQVFIELPENSRGIWEIAEFEIYGAGPAAFSRYTSNIIDLGRPAALGTLTWGGHIDAEARIELSARTGDDDDPNTYWRRTFRGNELTRFDAAGQPLTLRTYNRLQKGEQAGLTPDIEDWNFWNAPFDFAAGRGPMPVDQLRRYAQFRAEFHSTVEATGHLHYLQFSASIPPPASEALGRVQPLQAPALTPTLFTFYLEPHIAADDLGFDHLAISTTAQVQAVEAVRVGGVDVAYTIAQHTAEGFEVALPRMDQQRTSEQIEVDFRAEVFAYSTRFAGRIRDSTRPFEVAQSVTPKATNSLQVALLSLNEPLIGSLTPHPAVFTPNGDGRNDAVRIEYDLLYLVDAIQVELAVFDLAGREIRVIYAGPATSGRFAVEWDGRTPSGHLVPPGSYLVRLIAETDRGQQQRQRLVSVVY